MASPKEISKFLTLFRIGYFDFTDTLLPEINLKIQTQLGILRRKFGIEVVKLDVRDILNSFECLSDGLAAPLANELIEGAENIVGLDIRDILDAAKLYLVLKNIITKENVKALSIPCGPPEKILELGRATPCLPLAMIQDEGIIINCQSDLNSLFTMVLLNFCSNRPSFMGNTEVIDPKRGVVKLKHCACPLRMDGYGSDKHRYTLRDHHGRKIGVVGYVSLRKGQMVTLAKIEEDMGFMHMTRGTILNTYEDVVCRNNIEILIENSNFLMNRFEGHFTLVYGNFSQALLKICKNLEIKTNFIKTTT